MTDLTRDLLALAIVGIGLIVGAVWALDKFLLEPYFEEYRAACTAVNGKVVWNGNHVECLK